MFSRGFLRKITRSPVISKTQSHLASESPKKKGSREIPFLSREKNLQKSRIFFGPLVRDGKAFRPAGDRIYRKLQPTRPTKCNPSSSLSVSVTIFSHPVQGLGQFPVRGEARHSVIKMPITSGVRLFTLLNIFVHPTFESKARLSFIWGGVGHPRLYRRIPQLELSTRQVRHYSRRSALPQLQ